MASAVFLKISRSQCDKLPATDSGRLHESNAPYFISDSFYATANALQLRPVNITTTPSKYAALNCKSSRNRVCQFQEIKGKHL